VRAETTSERSEAKPGPLQSASDYLKDVRVEMTKVTWPTWEELKGQTLVVIVAVLLISAFIGAVDLVLSNLIKVLVRSLTS
jgi:preprotein translocase subunit SecE